MNINDLGAIVFAIYTVALLTYLAIFLWQCDDGEEKEKEETK